MRGRRGLAWSCHAVVLLWGAAWWLGPDRSAPEPPVRITAQVRPRPEPVPQPPPPAPAAPAAPAPQPEPRTPAPRPVGEAQVAEGEALLDGAGRFPVLSFGYETFPSFRAYVRSMRALGARFVVVVHREIAAEIDPETGAVERLASGSRFSPRARDYTDEPGLAAVTRAARQRFGGQAVVMMLVPRELDAGLFGGLAALLAERGEDRDALREIRGSYERGPDGGVRLRVEAAVRRDGTALPMEAVFDLGRIAGART